MALYLTQIFILLYKQLLHREIHRNERKHYYLSQGIQRLSVFQIGFFRKIYITGRTPYKRICNDSNIKRKQVTVLVAKLMFGHLFPPSYQQSPFIMDNGVNLREFRLASFFYENWILKQT